MHSLGKDYWLRLDNAAKIYPPVMNSEQTTVFRLTAILAEKVNADRLMAAVDAASKRFPYFGLSLTRGFFWYFLEYTGCKPRIHPDIGPICSPFAARKKGEPLFRLMVRENRISVEFMHILTDGGGGFEYLKFILARYYGDPPEEFPPLDLEAETEDSYNVNFRPDIPPSPIISTAWHMPYDLNPKPRLRTTTAEFPTTDFYNLAKSKGVSITEYLASLYLFTLQEIFHEEKSRGINKSRKIIRVQVPMNLRGRYNSRTMRNFSLFVTPEIDTRLGIYTFDEVLANVHQYMKTHLQNKYINRIINRNVRSEKMTIIKVMPLFLKYIALKIAYARHGARKYSGVMTNMGNIDLTGKSGDNVKGFVVYPPPPSKLIKVSCGVVGFNDKLRMTFSSMTSSRRLEKGMIGHLIANGISVKLI